MYDPKMEPREFVGDSRADALAKACAFFNRDASELEVHEVPPGSVLGLGARVAIVAVPKGAGDARRTARSEERPERGREGRGGRDREGRGDRGRRGGRGGSRERSEERRRSDEPRLQAATDEGPGEPSIGTAVGELSEIGRFIQGLIERLDVGSFEISESADGKNLILQVRGSAALKLSGGDTRALSAIQLLANQVAAKQGDAAARVIVDVEGPGEKREEALQRMAERAARRARETGRGVALEPMNARDRRAIHVALRDEPGIATMSVGEGRYRQVVVVPEGAPEYEEALQAAREESA